MTPEVQRIARVCARDYEKLAKPFSVEADGQTWAVATDGHLMMAVEHSGRGLQRATLPADRYVGAGLAQHEKIDTTFDALRTWAEPPTWTRACDDCGGTGTTKCEGCKGAGERDGTMKARIKCPECRGRKTLRCGGPLCRKGQTSTPAKRFGVIGRSVVNRELLARALDCLDDLGSCSVWFASALDAVHVRSIRAPCARIILMPTTAPRTADMPTLEVPIRTELLGATANQAGPPPSVTADTNAKVIEPYVPIERHAMVRNA